MLGEECLAHMPVNARCLIGDLLHGGTTSRRREGAPRVHGAARAVDAFFVVELGIELVHLYTASGESSVLAIVPTSRPQGFATFLSAELAKWIEYRLFAAGTMPSVILYTFTSMP